jgi:transcriptional regulator with XRE-family HTH domain
LQSLGQALLEARLKREMTQEALSLETGVHRNYIGGIERGERSPSVAAVITLAGALEVSVADLFRQAERAVSRS